MAQRRPQLRARAADDVEEAIEYLRAAGGHEVALAFIDALEHGLRQVVRNPALGSLRFAYELGIPELRALQLRRFPYIVFYVHRGDVVDVWRVLHGSRDLPGTLGIDT